MTRSLTAVAAGERLVTLLAAGRAGPGVTVVLAHLTVVTLSGGCAQLLTPGRPHRLLPATRDRDLGLAAVTGHSDLELARVAGSGVTPGHALVVLTAQSLPTGLLARRTRARAALLVTRVAPAVTQLLAFCLAGERLGALDLLSLGSAPALLLPHLKTGRTVAPVTSLSTVVGPAGQKLAAGVSTGRSGLCAGESEAGLATGTEPVQ